VGLAKAVFCSVGFSAVGKPPAAGSVWLSG